MKTVFCKFKNVGLFSGTKNIRKRGEACVEEKEEKGNNATFMNINEEDGFVESLYSSHF